MKGKLQFINADIRSLIAATLASLMCGALPAQQSLPPEVLAMAGVRRHMAEVIEHWPAYTCIQTMRRSTRQHGKAKEAGGETVQVEVAYIEGKEVYSRPGAGSFEGKSLTDVAGAGLVSSGTFTTLVRNLFVNRAAQVAYAGEERTGSRNLLRFTWDLPSLYRPWQLRIGGLQALVSAHGFFRADASSFDVIELEAEAAGIPAEFPVRAVQIRVGYAHTVVADERVLLPHSALVQWIDRSGDESRNEITFSHFRKYTGEAVLRTEAEPGAAQK